MLLLIVATGIILSWRYLQPLEGKATEAVTELKKIVSATDETSATLKTMAADVKRIADATEKCCVDKKVAPAPVKKVKKKKACATPASPKVKQEEEKVVAPLVTAPPKEEEKNAEPEKKVPVAPQPKAEAGFDPSSCGEGTEAVWDREAKRYECRAIATASAPAVAQYQLGSPCRLSDGTTGANVIVTYIYPNGNLQCSEVVLVPVPSKGKAVAQYLVCTVAGAAVGYYHGGIYSAISGGAGGAGGTYAGRELWGEDGGWLGCATGPAAGLIKFGGGHHRGASAAITSPSGGGTGIGDIIGPSGGGGGIN